MHIREVRFAKHKGKCKVCSARKLHTRAELISAQSASVLHNIALGRAELVTGRNGCVGPSCEVLFERRHCGRPGLPLPVHHDVDRHGAAGLLPGGVLRLQHYLQRSAAAGDGEYRTPLSALRAPARDANAQ